MRTDFGRHVFGLSAIAFGVLAFTWHDFSIWQQIRPLGAIAHREILLYFLAAVEIVGGVAILWERTARAGAAALGAVYLFFALMWIPVFIAAPVYNRLGSFFEQFSLVSAAMIVYVTAKPHVSAAARLARFGYYGFGVSVVSFTVEQLIYLNGTASFVPTWIPPGQMFWAITTTIAFGLGAIALLARCWALLASQLITLMIALFGVLVWLPAPFADPHSLTSWAGNAENWAICGAAWIVADYLGGQTAAPRSVKSGR